MATQVILLERVEKLGGMGDIVAVKPGYARNFLLPQGKALRASKNNIAYFETQKKNLEAENNKLKVEAEKLAKKLENLKVPLIRQASESGHLYGSVTSRDIATEVASVSKEAIDRSMVVLNQNYKSIGLFPVEITLHPEVKVPVMVNIARSPEEAEIQAKTGHALVADAAQYAEEEAEVVSADVEADLEGVLEEGALEAEKEKQEAEAVKAVEDAEKEEERKAKAEIKAAEKAAEEAAAEAAAENAETDEAAAEEATAVEDADKE